MNDANQDPRLQYPQDVTPGNHRGVAHRYLSALQERFPLGWTIGPMGGAWFGWDHVGNVIAMADSRKECITAAVVNNRPAWDK